MGANLTPMERADLFEAATGCSMIDIPGSAAPAHIAHTSDIRMYTNYYFREA